MTPDLHPPTDQPDDELRAALGTVSRWPASTVCVAVVGPEGVTASRGPVDQTFALASVTKLITSYACLIAIEEGTLTLDQPAGPPRATVRHLLAHAAGYGFDTGVMTAPGQRRIYSNTGFSVLADHLAAQAAMTAVDYVTEAVLVPLSMAATDLGEGDLAAGARSTMADLARFAGELLSPTLVSPATLGEATTVQFDGLDGVLPGFGQQSPNDWGLGFELRDHKHPHWTGSRCSSSTFGHFGGAGTFLWVDPTIGRALACLTDEPFGPWATTAWPTLTDAVIAALPHPDHG